MKLNILIDIVCDTGKTSKLVKVLKERGLSSKFLSYDSVRLKVNYELGREKIESALNSVLELKKLLMDLKTLWKAICIETWIKGEKEGGVKSNLVELDNGVCVHIRPGKSGETIKKLVLAKQCKWSGGGPVPESLTRRCVEAPENLDDIFVRIHYFVLSVLAHKRTK